MWTTHVHFVYCLSYLFTNIFCLHCDRVDQKLSGQGAGYNIDKAREIVEEMRLIQQDLQCGERERMELMQVGAAALITHVLKDHILFRRDNGVTARTELIVNIFSVYIQSSESCFCSPDCVNLQLY